MINNNNLENLKNMLKIDLEMTLNDDHMVIKCHNRCRLLSHLFHRAGLDIHCNNMGVFNIDYDDYSIPEVLKGMEIITQNPVWIVEFVEKYVDNKFMMTSTFKPVEVSSE